MNQCDFRHQGLGAVEFLPRLYNDECLAESVQELSTVESRRKLHDEQEVYRDTIRMF